MREHWKTRAGFVLASVGSAAGLGDLWRFPWMTAENGGSAFLGAYLAALLLVGIPGLVAEFVIGRRARRNPVGALRALSGSRGWWRFGFLALATAVLVLSFYSVVGGWVLRYLMASLTGAYFEAPQAYFADASFGLPATAFHALFLSAVAAVAAAGLRRGIETANWLLVPVLLAVLIGLAAWGATRPGGAAGLRFFLHFDWNYLASHPAEVCKAAVGQAFFTLSIGAGSMITYASYLGEERSLPADAVLIAGLDTLVGVLAGLAVFPLLFAQGIAPGEEGPGAIFVSVASAFAALPGGRLLGAVFFAATGAAALTSAVSILEIPVSYLVDEHRLSRRRAIAGVSGLALLLGAACATLPRLFAFVAEGLADSLLSVGMCGFLLFLGWAIPQEALAEVRTGAGRLGSSLGRAWLATARLFLPPLLLFLLISRGAAAAGFRLPPWASASLALVLASAAIPALRKSRA
ncbi:MAG: sodium-dependent transporter [Deltaproteobacteria bacterium]|nr:sodium-dependent transporter [Deltaproteobacteria bacterium]